MLCAAFTSCGFHLRGHHTGHQIDADSFQEEVRIAISAPGQLADLRYEIEQLLQGRRVNLAADGMPLELVEEAMSRRPLSLGRGAGTTQYELRMAVSYRFAGVPSVITTQRIYAFDPDSLIGNSEQEEVLADEMRRDIAAQLVIRVFATIGDVVED